MDAHDIMREKIRNRIAELSRSYSHGDMSRRGQEVLEEIRTLEYARLMWLVIWGKRDRFDEDDLLRQFIKGVDATSNTKYYPPPIGWSTVRKYAEETLRLSSA